MTKFKTYTKPEFDADFPTDDACLDKIMELRYGKEPTCAKCKRKAKFYRITGRRGYSCQHCRAQVYPCVGTPFEKSRTKLSVWFFAMYLFTTTRSGVAAKEVQRMYRVSYKCAWRIQKELRRLMGQVRPQYLYGVVEIDETYVGGRKRGKRGRGAAGKTVVLGLKQRGGPCITLIIPNARRETLLPIIQKYVRKGSTICTDEWVGYNGLSKLGYTHKTVNHGEKQWVAEDTDENKRASTNRNEWHWMNIKNSIKGTHIHTSPKHLQKYLDEFDFRYNTRHVQEQMFLILVDALAKDHRQVPA